MSYGDDFYAKLTSKDRSQREVVLGPAPHFYWLTIIIIRVLVVIVSCFSSTMVYYVYAHTVIQAATLKFEVQGDGQSYTSKKSFTDVI